MKVRTQTNKLQSLRKNVMELYISDHPLDCLTCPRQRRTAKLQEHGGRSRLARSSLWLRRRESPEGQEGRIGIRISRTTRRSALSAIAACAPCEETQGTFALTIAGRGFESRVAASENQPFHGIGVRCRARVRGGFARPRTLQEKTVIMLGQPEHSVVDDVRILPASAVRLKAEMKGSEVVRMVPNKNGQANDGHACVKGPLLHGATPRTRTASPSR